MAEGLAAAAGGATAMIDVSDGLGIDLDHLATASGIGVVLEAVPVAEGATLDEALAGGEDYELVFAARDPERGREGLRGRRGSRQPIRIGVCVADPTVRLVGSDPLPATGWEHRSEASGRRGWQAASACGSARVVGEDPPGRLDDPPGADARGADVQVGRRAVHESAHPLDVRVPAALGATMGVGDVHPEARVLPTEFTDSCHDDAFLERVPTTGRGVTLASSGMEPCETRPATAGIAPAPAATVTADLETGDLDVRPDPGAPRPRHARLLRGPGAATATS